jgi:hypothetical protein
LPITAGGAILSHPEKSAFWRQNPGVKNSEEFLQARLRKWPQAAIFLLSLSLNSV